MDQFEYDGADDLGGRILWGRVVVLVVAVLIFFLFGRCTASGGIDPAELEAVQGQLTDLSSENATLQSQNTSLMQQVATLENEVQQIGGGTPLTGATPAPTTGGTEAPPAGAPTTTPGTYVVQPGDTLSGIAEQVYGDPLAFGAIANANGITDQNPLQVGQQLTIPENPGA